EPPAEVQMTEAVETPQVMEAEALVAQDEPTSRIDLSEQKEIENKLQEKDQKKAVAVEALGLSAQGSVKGGERVLPKILKLLVLIAVLGGAGFAYQQGYLNPLLNHPKVTEMKDSLGPQ